MFAANLVLLPFRLALEGTKFNICTQLFLLHYLTSPINTTDVRKLVISTQPFLDTMDQLPVQYIEQWSRGWESVHFNFNFLSQCFFLQINVNFMFSYNANQVLSE